MSLRRPDWYDTAAMKPGDEANGCFAISAEDYEALLTAAEADSDLTWCEVCGAWLTIDDPFNAHVEDFSGCWKAATGEGDKCRSYRVSEQVNVIRSRRRSPCPTQDRS